MKNTRDGPSFQNIPATRREIYPKARGGEILMTNGFLALCSCTFNRPKRSCLHVDIHPQQMPLTAKKKKNCSGKRQRLASVCENGAGFWWQLPFEEPFNGKQREIRHLLLRKSQQACGGFVAVRRRLMTKEIRGQRCARLLTNQSGAGTLHRSNMATFIKAANIHTAPYHAR